MSSLGCPLCLIRIVADEELMGSPSPKWHGWVRDEYLSLKFYWMTRLQSCFKAWVVSGRHGMAPPLLATCFAISLQSWQQMVWNWRRTASWLLVILGFVSRAICHDRLKVVGEFCGDVENFIDPRLKLSGLVSPLRVLPSIPFWRILSCRNCLFVLISGLS